jgi:hypothetical protein
VKKREKEMPAGQRERWPARVAPWSIFAKRERKREEKKKE